MNEKDLDRSPDENRGYVPKKAHFLAASRNMKEKKEEGEGTDGEIRGHLSLDVNGSNFATRLFFPSSDDGRERRRRMPWSSY